MTTEMDSLGYDNRAVRRAALEQGLTSGKVAELAGVTPSTVRQVFNGRRVTETSMAKIAKALGLNLKQLVVEVAGKIV